MATPNKKIVKYLVILLGGFTTCLCIGLFFVLVGDVTLWFRKDNLTSDDSGEHSYRLLMKNHANNESSRGIVQLGEKLGIEEYISYFDERGNNFLISSFGSHEYQCTGSCYCEKDGRRLGTTTIVPIRKGMFYLVAAVSSVLAVGQAKNYFQAECEEKNSDKCKKDDIFTIVDDCTSVDVQKVLSELDPTGPEIVKKFQCTGKCMPTIFTDRRKSVGAIFLRKGASEEMIQRQLELYAKNAVQYRCERLSTSGIVTKRFNNDGQVAIKLVFYDNVDDGYRQNLQYDFTHFMMHPYCQKHGLRKVKYLDKLLKGVASLEFQGTEKQLGGAVLPMCSGHVHGQNPTIKCVEVKVFAK